jgi:pimeloyl-ACP methyl ester carboxylesterase
VRSQTAATDRLRVHWIESGPADGVPVVLLHGNLSTGRFYEHLMPGAPAGLRLIAPDMRGFGDTERVPIDATRGLRDWADDTAALLDALGITRPVHLAGWSTGGAAIAAFPTGTAACGATGRRAGPTTPAPAAAPAARTSRVASPRATARATTPRRRGTS